MNAPTLYPNKNLEMSPQVSRDDHPFCSMFIQLRTDNLYHACTCVHKCRRAILSVHAGRLQGLAGLGSRFGNRQDSTWWLSEFIRVDPCMHASVSSIHGRGLFRWVCLLITGRYIIYSCVDLPRRLLRLVRTADDRSISSLSAINHHACLRQEHPYCHIMCFATRDMTRARRQQKWLHS
jgi:hypothetical protein